MINKIIYFLICLISTLFLLLGILYVVAAMFEDSMDAFKLALIMFVCFAGTGFLAVKQLIRIEG